MEEKILVQGKSGDIKIVKIIGIIVVGIMCIVTFGLLLDYWDFVKNYSYFYVAMENKKNGVIISCIITTCLFAICLGLYISLTKILIVVTDKRVYGKAMFGKQVDLPLDSISAIGIGMFSSIAVATSSGKIIFWGIHNRDEIHKAISGLLIERQQEQNKVTPVTNIKQEVAQSCADELKKFKELLDDGVISQEEFDAKKKQLLGL